MMRFILLAVILVGLFISCNKKSDSKEMRKYYLAYNNGRNSIDTFKYINDTAKLRTLKAIDSLEIYYQKRFVTIIKLTNLPHSPIDGEFVAYWEKDLGIFYSRSLSWNNFNILQSDNDSINKYIVGLLGNLLLYEKMYSVPRF